MSLTPIIKSLDAVLRPQGFSRRKWLWNRRVGAFLDVLDIQASKAGDAFTLNAGGVDLEAYAVLWGETPGEFLDQPGCTVGARIGDLLDGRDKWWGIESSAAATEVVDQVRTHVTPFFDRLHDRGEMRRWLVEADVERKRYPPPIINLAILEDFLGNGDRRRELLDGLRAATSEPWRVRIDEVVERLSSRR